MIKPVYHYRCTIERIVDGDTLYATVDMGFYIYARVDFRLVGIDTPERGQPGFKEATARLAELLPPGSTVMVDSQGAGKYGRWLGDFILEDGRSANTVMVEEGFAVPYMT